MNDDELPVIDLTGDEPQTSQRLSPEVIDLTEDSLIPTKVTAERKSSMQTSSMYKHQNKNGYVYYDSPIVLDDDGNSSEDNCVVIDVEANSNVSRNLECIRRTINNASANSKTSKSQTKSPEKLKQGFLFASLKTPEGTSGTKHTAVHYEGSSLLVGPTQPVKVTVEVSKENVFPIFKSKKETHIGESSTVTSTIHPEQRGTRSDSFSVFKGVWEELKNPSFDPREKVIPLKAAYILGSLEVPQEQNTFCHESSNSASPGTSSISSLEASKVARSNNLEYQRTRVHNTRKNSPPPEREQVSPEQIRAVGAENSIASNKLTRAESSKKNAIPVLEPAPSLLVPIKSEKPDIVSRTMSHCREHIGKSLTKINTKNSQKKPAQAAVLPVEKPFKAPAPRNALSSSSQIETMLLNKERLVVMPEFLYQGVLEMCRSDTARLLRLVQDALERKNLTLYLFLINAQAINNADQGGQSVLSSVEFKPLGQWRSLFACLEKCSLDVDSSSSSSSSRRANNKFLNQCTQIIRIWNEFLVGEFLQDESDWDIGAFLSIWMKAFLSFDGTDAQFEGGISFLEGYSTLLGNTIRRRHMLFANPALSGPVISDSVSRVYIETVYRAILYILDPSAQNDKKEEDCAKPPVKLKPGRKPRNESSSSSNGSSDSSANGLLGDKNFVYQHLFSDKKVFEWDPAVAMKMLKVATSDLIPDKEFALFLLKAIVDVLTGFDDSDHQSGNQEDSKWTDLCAFICSDRVSDLCRFVLSGGRVSGSTKRTADGEEKSPLAELKLLVA